MIEDGQVLVMGEESMCYFAWTLHAKHPKAVVYRAIRGDILPIPWLYVPIPSYGEAWIFHQISEDFIEHPQIYIPEINCTISSKALQVQWNHATLKKKGMNLKIEWIGEDSQQRSGEF
jgi:hypothetical protein